MNAGPILVFGEVEDGRAAPVSLELASQARRLSDAVVVLAYGSSTEGVDKAFASAGASAVHLAEHPVADRLIGPFAAAAMASLVGAVSPRAILIGATYTGRDVAGRLAVRARLGVIANVIDLMDKDGRLVALNTIFGATQIVESGFTSSSPGIFLVRPKSFEVAAHEGDVAVSRLEPPTDVQDSARIIESHSETSTGPGLEEAPVVVSGGRGLGDASNFALLTELARLTHGSVGASRAVVDAGWVPYSMQVGQTGKTVKPTVYIACGISGAMQHTVGMKGAKNIIAINRDQDAPIFKLADLGVVGDCLTVLPKVIEEIKARQQQG